MSTTLTPDAAASDSTQATEPTLAEAFGEMAEGLVASEESGASAATQQATGDQTTQPTDDKAAAATQRADDPTKATPTTPSPTDATDKATADPLASAQPLPYTVDGETRTFEGVHVIPGMGAIVEQDAIPKLQDRLQQADRLVAQNRSLYETSREFERLGGRAGVEQLIADRAMLDRAASIMLGAIQNEEQLLALATDPVARQHLLRELDLSGREAQSRARVQFHEQASQATRAQETQTQATTAIGNAVGELAKQFPGLTTDDVTAIRTHAGRFQSAIVRPATADEARTAGVKTGEAIIDLPALHALLSDRHELRKQATESAALRAAANKDNAARLAATNPTGTTGKPANAPRPGAGKKTTAPDSRRPLDQLTSAELTRAMKTGRIYDMIGSDDQ